MALSKEKRRALDAMARRCKTYRRKIVDDPEQAILRAEIRAYEEEKKSGCIWDELIESVETARKNGD